MISTMLSYQYHHISAMISTTYDIGYDFGYDIPFDINNFLYHSPLISEFSDIMSEFSCFRSCYHGTCTTGWRCLLPPRACCSTSSCLPSHAKPRCIEAIGASSMDLEFKLEWYYSSSCGTGMASPRSPGRPVGRGPGKCSSCYYVLGIRQS